MNFVIANLEWELIPANSRGVVEEFFSAFTKSFDGTRVHMPYVLALQGVQTMISRAIKQYRNLEVLGKQL